MHLTPFELMCVGSPLNLVHAVVRRKISKLNKLLLNSFTSCKHLALYFMSALWYDTVCMYVAV